MFCCIVLGRAAAVLAMVLMMIELAVAVAMMVMVMVMLNTMKRRKPRLASNLVVRFAQLTSLVC